MAHGRQKRRLGAIGVVSRLLGLLQLMQPLLTLT
jgi:hypothetical protein